MELFFFVGHDVVENRYPTYGHVRTKKCWDPLKKLPKCRQNHFYLNSLVWGTPPKTCSIFLEKWWLEDVGRVFWLVVSNHLKNISQIGSFPWAKINIIWNHHLVSFPVFHRRRIEAKHQDASGDLPNKKVKKTLLLASSTRHQGIMEVVEKNIYFQCWY